MDQTDDGLKTMINSFHHMTPSMAKQILQSAASNKQPFMVYEMADNKIPFLVWLLMLPISLLMMIFMVWLMTPFAKGLTLKQIIFTYLIPIIPIFYAWDGQASAPRIYGLEDLDELLKGAQDEGYTWEKGPALNDDGKSIGIYLLGMPD